MRNITVAVDDETHETETERLKRQQREIRSQITAFSASDRLSREDSYNRS